MKKIMSAQILFVFVLFISMGCGCEPDPIEPDYPMEITTATLDGMWEFVNLNVPGFGDVTECAELTGWVAGWAGSVLLSFDFNATAETVTATSECTGLPLYDITNRNYWVDGTTLFIGGGPFPIISYDNVIGELILKIPNPDGGQGDLHVTLQKI